MNLQYIDIHTHSNRQSESLDIINIFPKDIDTINNDKFYSIGLHPWKVTEGVIQKQLQIINEIIKCVNVLAVGETGLDKYKEDFELQKSVFIKQIKIAQNHKKPLIIHCVKSYSELLEILKNKKLTIPIIIHRYSGNKTIVGQLLNYNCYYSFGHELFNIKSNVPQVFKSIPLSNIFLESDDSKMTIAEIYQKASELKGIPIKEIQTIIIQNFTNCFGNIIK